MSKLPLFARAFLFDFVTTLFPALLVLTAAGSPDAAIQAAGAAVGAAALAAAGRAIPAFNSWLAGELGV